MAPATERLLEEHRPIGCQSRLSAYFTACTPEQALVVKHGMAGSQGQQLDPAIHVYEVEAEGDTRCPMILVQTISVMLAKGAAATQANCVAKAYWATAGQRWYFIELLSPSIRILREVPFNRSFESVWRDVNDAYKLDQSIAVSIVRACR
jgi:hypothetical protein